MKYALYLVIHNVDIINYMILLILNQLRTSNGGKLESHDKHFYTHLLCFQTEERYNEMLLVAKKVMNIYCHEH